MATSGSVNTDMDPLPQNATLIEQENNWVEPLWRNAHFLWSFWVFARPIIAHWAAKSPNPALIQCGLTALDLNQEIDVINTKAIRYYDFDTLHIWARISLALFILGAITGLIAMFIYADNMMYSMGIVGAITICVLLFNYGSRYYIIQQRKKQWNESIQSIAKYVETELNEKYKPQGIMWMNRNRREISHVTSGGFMYAVTQTLYVEYNDICIAPTEQPDIVQQEEAINAQEVEEEAGQTEEKEPPAYRDVDEVKQVNDDVYQVREWLVSIHLAEYEGVFVDNGFDRMSLMKNMTESDLIAMGITKLAHKNQILDAVEITKLAC